MILVRVYMKDETIREYVYGTNEYDMAERVYAMFDKLRAKQSDPNALPERTIDYVELTLP